MKRRVRLPGGMVVPGGITQDPASPKPAPALEPRIPRASMVLAAGYVGSAVRYIGQRGKDTEVLDTVSIIIAHHLEEAQAICRKLAGESHYTGANLELAERLRKLAANFSNARTHEEHDSARKALREFAETEGNRFGVPIGTAVEEALRANEHGSETVTGTYIPHLRRNRSFPSHR